MKTRFAVMRFNLVVASISMCGDISEGHSPYSSSTGSHDEYA
jgi:hypothetical protein